MYVAMVLNIVFISLLVFILQLHEKAKGKASQATQSLLYSSAQSITTDYFILNDPHYKEDNCTLLFSAYP